MYDVIPSNPTTQEKNRQALACLPSHKRRNDPAPLNHGHLTVYSDYTEVYIPRVTVPKSKKTDAKRGKVSEFSKKSRINMLREVAKIRNMDNGFFCTLTYPGKWELDQSAPKRHLNALKRRIYAIFEGEVGIIWRLELKTRKTGASAGKIVPHFHLMVFNGDLPMYQFRDWLAWAWNMIVNPKDLKHRVTGTQVKPIPNKAATIGYVSKYTAKVDDDEDRGDWGRRWGICGNFDRSHTIQLPISRPEAIDLKRMIVGVLKARHRQRVQDAIKAKKSKRKIKKLIKKRYYKIIKRGTPLKGYGVIGVGDNNYDRQSAIDGTLIGRMIRVTLGATFSYPLC